MLTYPWNIIKALLPFFLSAAGFLGCTAKSASPISSLRGHEGLRLYTEAWIQNENHKTDSVLEKFTLRSKLRETLIGLEKSRAQKNRDTLTFKSRRFVLIDTSITYQKSLYRLRANGSTDCLIDGNKPSLGDDYIFKEAYFSATGKFVLGLFSFKGSDWLEGITFDGDTGVQIGPPVKGIKFTDIVWYGDEGFYYASYSNEYNEDLHTPLRSQLLRYHTIYDDNPDKIVLGQGGFQRRFISVAPLGDSLIYASAQDGMSENELLIKKLKPGSNEWIHLSKDNRSYLTMVGQDGEKVLYITNNDAPNSRLMSYDIHTEKTVEIIPEDPNLVLLGAYQLSDKLLLHYLRMGLSVFRQFDHTYKFQFEIAPAMPSGLRFVEQLDATKAQLHLENFFTEDYVIGYNMETGETLDAYPIEMQPYETTIVHYEGKDHVAIPMYLTSKKGLLKEGSAPVYLTTYGGFGLSWPPHYQDDFLLWLENDGILAWPLIRGGGELGTSWHESGRYEQKSNSVFDFVSAANYLTEMGYTIPERILITSRSYGGFIVGAATAEFPEKFGVSIPSVGIYDLINYTRYSYGAALESEFLTPDDANRDFLLKISPIDNIAATDYPAVMIIGSEDDDRVYPGHSYDFYSKLKNNQESTKPVILRTSRGGHYVGGGCSRINRIREVTDVLSFTWLQMNFNPPSLEAAMTVK